jgi:hypothetical protein
MCAVILLLDLVVDRRVVKVMAVFLKLQSEKKVNEVPKFWLIIYEYEFLLTGPIDPLEWPLAFSEYIVEKIKEKAPSNSQIGVRISNDNISDCIPYRPIFNFTPVFFDDHFEKIFNETDMLSGVLKLEVTYVAVPHVYGRV